LHILGAGGSNFAYLRECWFAEMTDFESNSESLDPKTPRKLFWPGGAKKAFL